MSFNGNLQPGTDAGEDLTTKGDIHGYSTENTRVAVGSNGTVLTADSTNSNGIAWASSAGSVLTTQGDVLYHNASGLARLAASTDGHVLTTKGTGANPEWAAAAAGGATVSSQTNNIGSTISTGSSTLIATGITITVPNRTGGKALIQSQVHVLNNNVSPNWTVTRWYNATDSTFLNPGPDGMQTSTAGQYGAGNINFAVVDLDGDTYDLYYAMDGGGTSFINVNTSATPAYAWSLEIS